MLVGDGQVQHNVNVGVSQQFVHCHGFGTNLFGAGLRCLHAQVCAGNKLQITKPFRDIFAYTSLIMPQPIMPILLCFILHSLRSILRFTVYLSFCLYYTVVWRANQFADSMK